jgi:Na+/proline symporter
MGVLNKKQVAIAFFSSLVMLVGIFVATMIKQYQGVDWEYLSTAVLKIAAISFLPAIAVFLLKLQNSLMSGVVGMVVGFLVAVIYVQISIAL